MFNIYHINFVNYYLILILKALIGEVFLNHSVFKHFSYMCSVHLIYIYSCTDFTGGCTAIRAASQMMNITESSSYSGKF